MGDVTRTDPLPRRLMGDASWRFEGEPFASRPEFDAAVRAYQTRNWGREWWRPESVVLPLARVLVQPDTSSFSLGTEPAPVELVAEDGEAFCAGELLFGVHNEFVGVLRTRDHRYFEGFALEADADPEAGQPPRYRVLLGS